MTNRKMQSVAPATAPDNNGFSLISNATLLELYAALLKCRIFEEHTRVLVKNNTLPASYRRHLGCAAPAVAVAIDLLPDDALAVCHGGLNVSLVRGVSLRQLYGSLGSSAGKTRPAKAAAQGQAAVRAAVQAAVTSKIEKSPRIAVLFCGPQEGKGAVQAAWREAMRCADAEKLPMIFVRHGDSDARARVRRAAHYGFPCIVVDGNDVVAIHRVASEAIVHARRGNGPTLIECKFVCSGGTKKRRGKAASDPILNLENYLSRKGLRAARVKVEVTARFERQLRTAQRFFAP